MGARVYGEGPSTRGGVLFIGEYPGIEEQKWGRPFVGKAGGELTRFLDGDTCPAREEVYLTNLMKEPPVKKGEFALSPQDEVDIWEEIERLRPSTIVTLGAHVAQYFLGEGTTLEQVHGIPHPVSLDIDARFQIRSLPAPMVLPCYNPAAALHSPNLQAAFAYDLRRLGLYLQGLLAPPVQDTAGRYYDLYTSAVPESSWPALDPYSPRRPLAHLAGICGAGDYAMDTEGLPGRPWCASFSTTPGYGHVVRAADMPALTAHLLALVRQDALSVTLHNALHDLQVLREMGLDLDEAGIPFDDTMVMAYLLGIEPQGLKALAYRHAGATHDDYLDIVREPSIRLAMEWVMALVERLPEFVPPQKYTKTQLKALSAPVAAAAVVDQGRIASPLEHARKLLLAMLVKPDPETLRARWAACRAREILVEEEGYLAFDDTDPPEASLDEVPELVAVNYAARDADLTVRVKRTLRPQITAMGLDDAYAADLAIVPMVDRMQAVGLQADVPHFQSLSVALTYEAEANREALHRVTGRDLNPNSGDQVAAYIFDTLHLDRWNANIRLKRTAGGRYSTDDKTLDALQLAHPSIPLIQEGREIRKLKGTYADVIPRLVGPDSRLHPRYRLTRADTGRLTAADPNVLALPKRSTRGKLIRAGFVAGPGRKLGEVDLCLAPETRVLTADLRWVPIGRLQVGDTLVSIDEQIRPDVHGRRMNTSRIEGTLRRVDERFRLILDNGREIVTTADHPWLVYQQSSHAPGYHQWVKTRDLTVGRQLRYFGDPWEVDTSYEGGWLAGIFDGEGSFDREGATITFTQNDGATLERVRAALTRRGYDFHTPHRRDSGFKKGDSRAYSIWMCGVADCAHFIGSIRPIRFLEGVTRLWEGKNPRSHRLRKESPTVSPVVRVAAILPEGRGEVVSIQTTERTYIAEGVFTHNSQIEMVQFAVDSGDTTMLDAFRRGIDFHRQTASMLLSKPMDTITGDERFAAKAVNFGILMGITAFGLLDQFHKNGQLHYTLEMCEALLRAWHRTYEGGSRYIDQKHAEARRYGFVRDYWGRLRWLEGIRSYDKYIREAAERMAQATPTQSGAQGLMKRGMAALWPVLKEMRRQGIWVECLLQIHDALVFEYDDDPAVEALLEAATLTALCTTITYPIPIHAKAVMGVARLSDL